MFSPRGVINLAHTDAQRDQFFRRGNHMRLNGIDSEWLTRDELARMVPHLDCSDRARFPIVTVLRALRAALLCAGAGLFRDR
jgi:sarcosine oxidase subunit beta